MMKIQRYTMADMRAAMQVIQQDHGADAVIVSREKVENGVVVIAAVDYDDTLYQQLKGDGNNPLWLDAYCQKNGVDVDAGVVNITGVVEPSGASNDELDLMRQELHAMRDSLEQHLVTAANNQIGLQYPHLSKVLLQLNNMGFSDALCQRLARMIADKPLDKNLLGSALKQLMPLIPVLSVEQEPSMAFAGLSKISGQLINTLNQPPRIMAFVGPTGVGKTTGLAKVAAHLLLGHGTATAQNIAFICCDTSRIGAFEQLNVFGKILGVPVFRAANKQELEQQLLRLHNKKHILIDTEGFCKRQDLLPDALAMLRDLHEGQQDIHNYLVLSADMQPRMMHEAYRLYEPINPRAVVITKLDEAVELGSVISVVIENRLPLAYLSNGQEVPDSLSAASSEQLINSCLNLFKAQIKMQQRQAVDATQKPYTSEAETSGLAMVEAV
ncbi:MAG: hypothetical protein HRU20_20320 [Pseudomonadales bacterium]|nr:hypothetical protein [Pseudomonadales bacterium]